MFTVDEQRYALRLASVERVARLVEITPLPGAPEIVPGMINVRGRLIPVVSMRRRFRLPEDGPEANAVLIIASTAKRSVALMVDAAIGIVTCPEADLIGAEQILPGIAHIQGVVKLPDGLLLIHDLDTLLSLAEERHLDEAIKTI